VCRRAAAAYCAPCSNTMAAHTNKSMEVCAWACRAEISSTITVVNTASAKTVFNTLIQP
jgi:hypothetical protein